MQLQQLQPYVYTKPSCMCVLFQAPDIDEQGHGGVHYRGAIFQGAPSPWADVILLSLQLQGGVGWEREGRTPYQGAELLQRAAQRDVLQELHKVGGRRAVLVAANGPVVVPPRAAALLVIVRQRRAT
jgi:hypothetical protein